ncbi:MAG: SDR family oxidoreductase [Alphaproteobacteria bacterium]|nr:SDR family oxidoreductase [Alphaproteobacteria bacterium]
MMPGLFDLTGKVALVTGSSRGIGRSIAEEMAALGAKVVVTSRSAESCQEAVDAITAAGGEAVALPAHVGRRDAVEDLAAKALDHFGKVDILVCNAATNPYFGPLSGLTDEAFLKIMQTNVQGPLWLCNALIPQMAERRDGAVILLSSIAGILGNGAIGAYGISKAADAQLARNLAIDWGKDNIRVNAIAPGLVKTDFARALWEDPERRQRVEDASPLGRIGEPRDIAGAACFLASDAGRYVTGQTLVVDGGAIISDTVG